MFGLYLASAILGWAFVGLFLFGGIDTDADFDADVDADVDFDADGGLASGLASAALSLLSFRSIMFFMAFFGLTGMVLDLIGTGTVLTLLAAIGVGVFAWVLNSFVFRALKVADVSSTLVEADLRGAIGRVVLPINPGHRGRISIEAGDQRRYLTAEPFDPARRPSYAVGDAIVVVDLDRGTARVAPIEVNQ
jgi:membrane protein implicated in regulation of membrane protease activity